MTQTNSDMSTKLNAEDRPPMTHELKCHPGPFRAVKDGSKPFEWRKDDRDYLVGDTLRLREWIPNEGVINGIKVYGHHTGDELIRTVTYIIREGFGIPDGYCIMGLAHPFADDWDALLALLVESQTYIGGDWRERRDAVLAKYPRT